MCGGGVSGVALGLIRSHVEDALQAARAASLGKRELVRARLIIDCDGFSLENIRHIPVLKNIIALGKSYFPEVAASVTVVRAPSFIATFYSLLTPFLPKLLQDKISILGKDYQDGLRTHTSLGADSLPEFLGGKVKSQNNVQPVPRNAWKSVHSD